MTESIKLPVGIESFDEIRSDGYYYVDKTKLIEASARIVWRCPPSPSPKRRSH